MEIISSSPLFWGLAIIGVIFTGISKSGFAGGAGVVAVPLLALVVPVETAVALMLPILLVMDLRTITYYWQHRSGLELKKLLPAALIGIALGGWLLAWVSPFALTLSLGILSLLFAFWQNLAPLVARLPGSAWLWGAMSGVTSTLIHAGGPPLNMYLIGRGLPKLAWLATAGVVFGVMNLIKLVPYTLAGFWNRELLVTALILVPAAYLGVYLGYRLQYYFNEWVFLLSCRWLLALSGLALLGKAVSG
ncbi:sulfite exporter TauE/SafE family protein [Microbulbifer sp. HZ11]|uniref:sulfite exporter TauE/SafE family protein n=1 Tax=unclassified Microbulbifer TaxID=2619833 RepID=UPI00068E7996|nr:sulfite exporter TauE/SafE family protein [Microbulbifer sp. HZ11]